MSIKPRVILEKLSTTLFDCAQYANQIQHRIEALEEKAEAENLFAAALSDADLTIQSAVELAIMANLPGVPFFGEEWKSSRNTKYLPGRFFTEHSPYLLTLDPIDGTRLYLDGLSTYHIILSVISRERFEAVMILNPGLGDYIFALAGEGAFKGIIGESLNTAKRWEIGTGARAVYLSPELKPALEAMQAKFGEAHCAADYDKSNPLPHLSGILRGQLRAGVIASSQVIDGAAIAFVAKEMGCKVSTLTGESPPAIIDYPELILPGMIVADSEESWQGVKDVLIEHHHQEVRQLMNSSAPK